MCGIVGAFSFRNSSFRVSESYLEAMRDTMSHRGPDGAGAFISSDGRLGLGHRRLAIIDLSDNALQPMTNEDGTLRVVFNGEIYNHADIRKELENLGGHRWKTDHSDTEVILHAFEQWGIACLEKFRGMFAIALWDAKKRELWLIRDRMGVKPLYYSIHHGRVTFASEIKALLADPEQKREVNEEALYYYLSFNAPPAPLTLFEGIRKVAPSNWLRISDDGQVNESRYWDVWDHTEPLTTASEAEIAERLLAELRTCVQLRKVSDVPVGVFLSGGIDSSTNAALFSEGGGEPVRTFSIGYDQEYKTYPSELPYARMVAQKVGAEHHELLLKESDLIDTLPLIIRHQDEPLADPVCLPVYFVSKLARDNGVKVCQVGEGSDELFSGYPYWNQSQRLQRFCNVVRFPGFMSSLGVGAANLLEGGPNSSYPRRWRCEMARRAFSNRPVFWGGAEVMSDWQKQTILSPRLRKKFAHLSSWEALRPIRQRFEENAWEPSPLNWMSYLDLNLRLPELLLMRLDKMSMATSLEAREPFLDHKLVELVMSIPTAIKTQGGVLKYILKKAVRGVIPDEIIDRRKQGFGVPTLEWSQTLYGDYMKKELRDFADTADIFQYEGLLPHVKKRGWALLNVAMWWKQYIGSAPSLPPSLPVRVPSLTQPIGVRNMPLPVGKTV
jgi:asparagine synthase (glutamine-hydrolysing)